MIGCLRTRVRKQPIMALYSESENEQVALLSSSRRPGLVCGVWCFLVILTFSLESMIRIVNKLAEMFLYDPIQK